MIEKLSAPTEEPSSAAGVTTVARAGTTGDSGDEDDFETLVLESLPHLRAFALTLCRDRTWADDLVQETVVKALAAEKSFQPGTNFRAWVFTILRNHFLNEVRRPRHRDAALEDASEAAVAVAPSQEPRAIWSAISRLRP